MGDFGGLDMEESSGILNYREFFSVDDEEIVEEIRLLMENQIFFLLQGQEMLQNFKSRISVYVFSNYGDFINFSMGVVRNFKRRRSFY